VGRPSDVGGFVVDRLPLHRVVVSRSLAVFPSPWIALVAKITQLEPTSGVSPQPAESAGVTITWSV
jgi:hypothetical protein